VDINRKSDVMRFKLFEILMILSGLLIVLMSLLMDLFYSGSPGIGFEQLAGIVVGSIVILIGTRRLLFPNKHNWEILLFGVYLGGIFIVGLRPSEAMLDYHSSLLGMNSLSKRDLVVNVAGFVPLGFLAMTAVEAKFAGHKKTFYHIALAIIFGIGVSVTLEILQYYWIPGRYSSLYDLLTNTAGTIIGVLAYLFIHKKSVDAVK